MVIFTTHKSLCATAISSFLTTNHGRLVFAVLRNLLYYDCIVQLSKRMIMMQIICP